MRRAGLLPGLCAFYGLAPREWDEMAADDRDVLVAAFAAEVRESRG